MRILLCGGGTGGHIYPALALARYMQKADREAELLFLGAHHGLETRLVPRAGFPLETISIRAYRRRFRELFPAAVDMGKSSVQVLRVLRKFRPQMVLGTGGYASGPVVFWAWAGGYPTVIHEQNVIPGRTNRFLAPLVRRVCLSFEASREHFSRRARSKGHLTVTGNPRASEVRACSREEGARIFGLDPSSKTLLVFGGSQGALRINQVMIECLSQGLLPGGIQILYVTGERYYREVSGELDKLDLPGLHLLPYTEDMPAALAAADLVVSRAGATALAEITACGVPALLIPSPNVADNHQYYNARLLEDREAARVILEENFTPLTFSREVNFMLEQEEKLKLMSRRSEEIGDPRSVEKMYRVVTEVAAG